MSRVRNAVEFQQAHRQIRYFYDQLYRRRVETIRAEYARSPARITPTSVDDALEAHVREYVVNSLLGALNWRLNASVEHGLPNLIPEAPVASSTNGTIRFLDYLGVEGNDGIDPLMIVETKRPRSLLPARRVPVTNSDLRATATESVSEIISAGLGGESLTGEWDNWLRTQRSYVQLVFSRRSLCPRRVVMTSGQWLIIFVDPADSFLGANLPDPNKIVVFENSDEIDERSNEVFGWLEHQIVLDEAPALSPGEILFHVSSEEVDNVMHGLRLLYIEEPGFESLRPVIKLKPILFLRSRYGAWLRIESRAEITIPHASEELPEHLSRVETLAEGLLTEINTRLSIGLAPATIESHYANAEDFGVLPGIAGSNNLPHYDEYIVVTGQYTHYLRLEPTVPDCPHHNWGKSNRTGYATLVSIQSRSTHPRSFFISDEDNHCAHRDVAAVKSAQITPQNRERCGSRSGKDYDPFCEIWRFESHLCCRTCIFENVCGAADVFSLPCRRNVTLPDTP